MHVGTLFAPGFQVLGASLGLYRRAAPWILGLGLLAAIGRAIQVGRGRAWPRPTYVAFEVAVEAVRLLIIVVIVGLGDPVAGVRRIVAFIAGHGRGEALGRFFAGLRLHWPEVLAAVLLFALAAAAANVAIFAVAGLPAARRLAAAAGVAGADRKRSVLATVLFLKNLTIIPFTAVWVWELVLYLAR